MKIKKKFLLNQDICNLNDKILLISDTENKVLLLKEALLLKEDKDIIKISENKDKVPICKLEFLSKFLFKISKKNKKSKNNKQKKIIVKLTCNNFDLNIYLKKILNILNKKNNIYINFLIKNKFYIYKEGKKIGIKKNIVIRILEIISYFIINLGDKFKFKSSNDKLNFFLKDHNLITIFIKDKTKILENINLIEKFFDLLDFSFIIHNK